MLSYKKQLSDKDTEINGLKKENAISGSIKSLEKILTDEKYTEKQKTFIIKRFKPIELEDLSDDSLKKYITESEKEYKEYASMFGDKIEKDDKNPDKDDKDKGSTGSDGKDGDSEESDDVDALVSEIVNTD